MATTPSAAEVTAVVGDGSVWVLSLPVLLLDPDFDTADDLDLWPVTLIWTAVRDEEAPPDR